jgi:hypothetical protein
VNRPMPETDRYPIPTTPFLARIHIWVNPYERLQHVIFKSRHLVTDFRADFRRSQDKFTEIRLFVEAVIVIVRLPFWHRVAIYGKYRS